MGKKWGILYLVCKKNWAVQPKKMARGFPTLMSTISPSEIFFDIVKNQLIVLYSIEILNFYSTENLTLSLPQENL